MLLNPINVFVKCTLISIIIYNDSNFMHLAVARQKSLKDIGFGNNKSADRTILIVNLSFCHKQKTQDKKFQKFIDAIE